MGKTDWKTLGELWITFFKIGAVTFGGGMAMLPILERELAVKKGWTTSGELLDYFTICQSTPGIIAANVSIFLGYKRAGKLGGIIAPLGVITPSVIVITLLAAFLSSFSEIPAVQRAMAGINVGVAAMLTYTVVSFCKKAVRGLFGTAVFLAAFSMLYIFNVNTLWVIVFGALSGLASAVLNGELKEAKE